MHIPVNAVLKNHMLIVKYIYN